MRVSYLLCSSHFFEAILVFSKNLNSFSLPIFVLNRYSIDFWSLMERLLPEMGCSVQPKAYSPTSYLLGRKAPQQLCTLSQRVNDRPPRPSCRARIAGSIPYNLPPPTSETEVSGYQSRHLSLPIGRHGLA